MTIEFTVQKYLEFMRDLNSLVEHKNIYYFFFGNLPHLFFEANNHIQKQVDDMFLKANRDHFVFEPPKEGETESFIIKQRKRWERKNGKKCEVAENVMIVGKTPADYDKAVKRITMQKVQVTFPWLKSAIVPDPVLPPVVPSESL